MYGESPVSGGVQYLATARQFDIPVKSVPILKRVLRLNKPKVPRVQHGFVQHLGSGALFSLLIEDRPIIDDALGANRS